MLIMWNLSFFGLICFLIPFTYGSAIPMWEYLSRGEKMNHLFNLFVRQVEKYCSGRAEPDCSKLLLVYGLTNLAKMEDESLDDMDPYQRGANEIVWDSMMKGPSKQNQINDFGTKSMFSKEIQSSISEKKEEKNWNEPELGSLEAASSIDVETTEPQSFLLGPMVVRVLPNGMPIPGEKNNFPKDEDAEEFEPSKFRRLIQGGPSSGSTPQKRSPSEKEIYENLNGENNLPKMNYLHVSNGENEFKTSRPILRSQS